MIYEITSSLPMFKTLNLHPGLNILLADKTDQSVETDTRNGSGKSSLIEIIHYLLGGKAEPKSMFRKQPLNEHWFAMTFDLAHRKVTVRRSGTNPSKVTVLSEQNQDEPEVEETISNAAWTRRLAAETFAINEGGGLPSYRSAVSYFARRQGGGGFHTPTKHFSMQMTSDVQVNLSLLLGLDVELPLEWQQVRERERELDAVRGAARGGALGQIVGNAGELASEMAGAEDELASVVAAVENFTVIPVYQMVESEVTAAGQRVRALNNQIISDREYIHHLRRATEEVVEATTVGLEDLFAAARVQLPEVTLAAFRDVETFHESVVSNRRQYLAAELQRIENEVEVSVQERDDLARRRSDGMRLLSSGGAVETLMELQRDVVRRQVHVEELRRRYETARTLESEQGELGIDRQRLAMTLRRDLDERQEVLRPAYVVFERLSQRLYSPDQRGRLVVNATENGPEITASIPRGKSKGITNMQVFCFDMTLSTLAARKGQGPGFLIHDSHLFDGVDERQVEIALAAGAEAAVTEGFQYIVTLNSDQMPPAEDLQKFVLPQRLTDLGESGGLFGLRFEG